MHLVHLQWPGFEMRCLKCGSTCVILENDQGWSKTSGHWGGINLECRGCGHFAVIV